MEAPGSDMPVSEVGNVDCMAYMKSLPDKFFDLVVADPPYFSGPERRAYYGSAVSTTAVARKEYPVTDKWKVPGKEVFDEIKRISRHYIVWGCNYFDYVFDHGRIIWDKCNGNSTFSDCEIAATNLFDSVRMFRFMWNGMMQGKSIKEGHVMQGDKSKNEFRIHPTQKPVALYAWIFQNYCRGGQKIFDPFLGSGSSRIAAYKMGLDFYGCEIDEGYFEAAKKRFEKEALGREEFNGYNIVQQSLF